MPAPRHLKWPLELGAHGALATNQQDSDADIATAISVILAYPVGSRLDRPRFGIPIEALTTTGPDLDEIRLAVTANEARADVQTDLNEARLREAIEQVGLGFSPKGNE